MSINKDFCIETIKYSENSIFNKIFKAAQPDFSFSSYHDYSIVALLLSALSFYNLNSTFNNLEIDKVLILEITCCLFLISTLKRFLYYEDAYKITKKVKNEFEKNDYYLKKNNNEVVFSEINCNLNAYFDIEPFYEEEKDFNDYLEKEIKLISQVRFKDMRYINEAESKYNNNNLVHEFSSYNLEDFSSFEIVGFLICGKPWLSNKEQLIENNYFTNVLVVLNKATAIYYYIFLQSNFIGNTNDFSFFFKNDLYAEFNALVKNPFYKYINYDLFKILYSKNLEVAEKIAGNSVILKEKISAFVKKKLEENLFIKNSKLFLFNEENLDNGFLFYNLQFLAENQIKELTLKEFNEKGKFNKAIKININLNKKDNLTLNKIDACIINKDNEVFNNVSFLTLSVIDQN